MSEVISTTEQAQAIEAPKEGTQTSSFKVVLLTLALSVAGPLLSLFFTIAVGAQWIGDGLAATVRDQLLNILAVVTSVLSGLGVIGGSAVAARFISERGKVSVIKTQGQVAVAKLEAASSSNRSSES